MRSFVSFALYSLLGILLTVGGISVLEKPVLFIAIFVTAAGIELTSRFTSRDDS